MAGSEDVPACISLGARVCPQLPSEPDSRVAFIESLSRCAGLSPCGPGRAETSGYSVELCFVTCVFCLQNFGSKSVG